jgi:predicted ribosome quality control (RQC) complex YloA/Tae2 family protein
LYFIIRGGKTNVILKSGSKIKFFKKNQLSDPELTEIGNKTYIAYKNMPQISDEFDNISDYKSFKSLFPAGSRILYNEIITRKGRGFSSALRECIKEILESNIVVANDDGKVVFVPVTFNKLSAAEETFTSYNSALNKYISEFYVHGRKSRTIKELEQYVNKEKERLSNKLNNLKSRIESGSQDEKYYINGNLLVNNLHLIKKGMKEIKLKDYEKNEEYLIKLDPRLSPQDNAGKYFEKAKDEKKNFIKSKELFSLTEAKFEYYNDISKQLNENEDLSELIELRKKLGIGVKKTVDKNFSENVNLREFLIENKYRVWVGKDSKSNDLLSTKIAKQNDYWFHARGLPGSHVILRVDNPKEGVPKNILNAAASIAAFYSKAKTAAMAPVSYTLRKYVRKKKGMEPGKVLISKEKVLLVKPELPKNCESITD